MAASRKNSALKLFVNGRRARDLHGLTDLAGNLLSSFDTATTRAFSGLQRRAVPAATRAVRAHYNVKARSLSGRFRVETGSKGRRGDRDDYLSIWASTRGISLIEFSGAWRGRKSAGATARIGKDGAAKTYGSAFIASVGWRGASGASIKADTVQRGIWVRSFASTGRRNARGPLRLLRGPSPFEMLSGLDHAPARASRDQALSELTTFYSTELHRLWRLNRKGALGG